jgi:phage terminase large subunit-like protein
MALRISGPKGDRPRMVISTTPRMIAALKKLLAQPQTVVTRAKTSDNAANLDPGTLAYLQTRYGGTTLGRQELDGELLEDLEGALWTRGILESCRVPEAPALRRIVVAIDPAGSSNKRSDETGIVAAGTAQDGHHYILRDASGRYTPEGWARRAVSLYEQLNADCIVCESNFGGAMVESTIKQTNTRARVKMVTASRGKAVRAEPVVALYEQSRVHHVGQFPELEDQLCGWSPVDSTHSPDRLDALVWAVSELMGARGPIRISPEAMALFSKPCPPPWMLAP